MNYLYKRAACPRLCFVGPMIGRNPGFVTTPGELLSDKFAESGFPVISVSARSSRYQRLVDIVHTIVQRRRSIDIMVLQVYGERSFVVEDVASALAKIFKHRIVMYLHGGTLPAFFSRFPRWTHRVLCRADALVAPSMFLARTVANYGFRAEVISNPLDLSLYPYCYRPKVHARLLWMRAFYSYYNPFMAVRVLASLRSKLQEARLVMAGPDNGVEASVRQLAKSLGVEHAVRFAGFLNKTSKIREAAGADIFLNTNTIDNMPVSVLEACALGLPVVATSVGGIPDLLIDGETGLLVPDDDSDAMAKAVCRLLHEPGLAGHLSAKGRQLAEACAWEQVYPRWKQLFTDLVLGHRPGPREDSTTGGSRASHERRDM